MLFLFQEVIQNLMPFLQVNKCDTDCLSFVKSSMDQPEVLCLISITSSSNGNIIVLI